MREFSLGLVILCLCLNLLAGPAWAATYHVAVGGSGGCGGGAANPMGSIGFAINNCARSPGDIIYAHNGVYDEYLTAIDWASGTNFTIGGGAITLASAPGEMATIRPSFNGTDNVLMVIYSDKNYIVFDRITFDASTFELINPGTPEESGGRVIELVPLARIDGHQPPGFIRFQNCEVIGSPVGNTFQLGSGRNEFVGNTIRNSGAYAFYVSSDNNLIEYNRIHDNAGYAVHIYADNTDDYTGSDLLFSNVVRNNYISRNTVVSGGAPATANVTIAYGSDNRLYNNIFDGNFGAAEAVIAIRDVNHTPFVTPLVAHNTITGNDTASYCIVLSDGGNAQVRNNICWDNTGNDIAALSGGGSISDNLTTLDPLFIDAGAGDYRLDTDSPAKDAGFPLTEVTTDASVPPVARPQPPGGDYDMGAFEAGEGTTPTLDTFHAAGSGAPSTDCAAATSSSTPYIVTNAASLGGFLSCGLGGSTFVFAAGTYVASLVTSDSPVASGSTGSPTTLMAAAGATVTFKSSTGGAVIYLNRGATDHHLTFDHLILGGDNTAGVNGLVTTSGTHHITVRDSEIKEMYYQALGLDGASDVEILRTNIHDGGGGDSAPLVQIVGSTNVRIAESTVAASLSGVPGIDVSGSSTGVLIERSTIRNNTGIGLRVAGSSTVTLQNSLLYQNSKGTQWQTGTSASKAYYNTVWSNTGECFLFDAGVTTSEAKNNVCWANGSAIVNNAGGGVVTTPNHTTDPSFVSTTPGAVGFLRLGPTSSARETATPIAGVTTDFNGTSRPLGPIPDQGAFEETPVAGPPGLAPRAPVYGTTHFLGPY